MAVFGGQPEAYVTSSASNTSRPRRIAASLQNLASHPQAVLWCCVCTTTKASEDHTACFAEPGEDALRGEWVRGTLAASTRAFIYPPAGEGGAATLRLMVPTAGEEDHGAEPLVAIPPRSSAQGRSPPDLPGTPGRPKAPRRTMVLASAIAALVIMVVALAGALYLALAARKGAAATAQPLPLPQINASVPQENK